MAIATVNPSTGKTEKTFSALTNEQIEAKLARGHAAFKSGLFDSIESRAPKMRRAGEILEAEKEKFARLMTLEMGKTLKSARDEAAKCAKGCFYYAENAAKFLADQPLQDAEATAYVRFQPLGMVLAIMPWNFPFWQVIRFAAPALMAGNVGLLKHSSNVPQCALALEDIFLRAGFGEGSFQTLLIGADKVPSLLQDSRVVAATLTGSEPAGMQVAAEAGKQIKHTVLELGGSDPFVVMPSADFAKAVATAVQARTINNGQSCIAAKRFLVHDKIYDQFEKEFVARFKALKVGDPMQDTTDIGPLSSERAVIDLENQVGRAAEAGGRILVGGKRAPGDGFYFQPTVISGLFADSIIAKEELFGPVATLFRFKTIAEAIAIANITTFGLGSSVWTEDEAEKTQFINGIEAGQVFVNCMVASQPHMPFGGTKRSGYGRELGAFGIHEFVNAKTVRIQKT